MSAQQQVLAAGGAPYVAPPGQALITTSQTWVCPDGVTSVSAIYVGRGGSSVDYLAPGSGGGGGGALAYRNAVAVTPGSSYSVIIDGSGSSAFGCVAGAGVTPITATAVGPVAGGSPSGSYTAGFAGGAGWRAEPNMKGGGGGAGGYGGAGGSAGAGSSTSGSAGSGGGAGGGATSNSMYNCHGGGVGVLGAGANGAGGVFYAPASYGLPGSSGSATTYGGGGGVGDYPSGGPGAVRIIWPGNLRQFPSTRTANE